MIYINTDKKEKLKITKENVYLVLDFDRTITAAKSTDSWDASGKLLGEEFKVKINELYQKYRPIELDYNISETKKNEEMLKWYSEVMELYYKYNLTQEKLVKSVLKSNLIFRKGIKEFLKNMYENNIPVIILSAGIGNVIVEFLKNNKMCYNNIVQIISNFIEFDQKGNMKKFDNKKIIHSLNKTIDGHVSEKINKELNKKEYKILIGDLIEDNKMVDERELNSTLRIGILDINIDENLDRFNKNFDIVLTRTRHII